MAEPYEKTSKMTEALDDLAQKSFGRKRTESIEGDICVACGAKAPPESFKDDLSRKEYTISGMCQSCQDGVFVEEIIS